MRFDVLTIFPEAFDALRVGLLGKAVESGLVSVGVHDLRNWASPPHRKVDDVPFGGGPGMVMTPGPVVEAVESLRGPGSLVVLLAAGGRPFDQARAEELSREEHILVVCGRYEGMDDRIRHILGAEEVSIGPFVLSGGEYAALCLIDAVARLEEGVLGNESSLAEESFSSGLLEYPQFTRPQEFRGLRVPEVLLSGDHARIAAWRRRQALVKTVLTRPELLDRAALTEAERLQVERWKTEETDIID